MNALKNVTALARPLDPRYPSNVLIMLLTVAIGAAIFIERLIGGETFSEAIISAASGALAAFLAWALNREIDPDREESANGAAIITVLLMFLLGIDPALLALFLLLMAARVINLITGVHVHPADMLLLALLTGLTATTDFWVAGLAGVLAFLLDQRTASPHPRGLLYAGLLLIVWAVGLFGWGDPDLLIALISLWGWLVLGTIFLVSRYVIPGFPDPLASLTDFTQRPVDRQRIVFANILLALILALEVWRLGEAGAAGLAPLWAAFISVVGYNLGDIFSGKHPTRTNL
ncbi:MAG: hypothetical protein ACLFTK_17760 [Anaerolineales bacterium]